MNSFLLRNLRTKIALAVTVGALALACSGSSETAEEPTFAPHVTALDVVSQADNRSTFASLVDAADMRDVLTQQQAITVFAPSNAAFENIPEPVFARLRSPSHKAMLSLLVRHHVVQGRIDSPELLTAAPRVTFANTTLSFVVSENDDDDVVGGMAGLDLPDLVVQNGTVHGIDTVTFPSLTDLLKVYKDDTRSFATFQRAVEASGLLPSLEGTGLTVFAPDDAAFAALGQAEVDALFADKSRLVAMVSAHIVDQVLFAEQLSGELKTRSGATVKLSGAPDAIRVETASGSARISMTDLLSSTATVHAVDHVLAK